MKKTYLQKALLLSTALPAAFIATAHAGEITVGVPTSPATSVQGSVVNSEIADAIINPDSSDIKITVPTNGVILGSSIVLNPGASQGDGKVEFINNGEIGSLDATNGAVTEIVGTTFNGRSAAGAANTFTGSNAGLITGGLNARNFGGNVAITNAGTVHAGIEATGKANVSVETSAAGAVRSGNVTATSQVSDTSVTANGIITQDYTSGTATIDQQGDAANQAASTRGNLTATALNGATVTVGGKAGNVQANAGGTVQQVYGSNTVTSGTVSTSTFHYDTTRGGGEASVTIQQDADVNSAEAISIGGANLNIDGNVTNNVTATSDGSSTTQTSVIVSDGGVSVSSNYEYTDTASGKAANVTVGQTGKIDGNLIATGNGGATGLVDGSVKGDVRLGSQATDYNYATSSKNSAGHSTYGESESYTAAGGAAIGTVGKTGTVGGNLIAHADAGVTLSNAGLIKGNVDGNSQYNGSSYDNVDSTSSSISGSLTTNISETGNKDTYQQTGGEASFTNASDARVEGHVSLEAVGDVTVSNSGTVFGTTRAISSGVSTTSENATKNTTSTAIGTPPALDVTTTTNESRTASTSTAVGGDASGTYAGTNGTLNFNAPVQNGSIYQVADKNSTANITGVVYGELEVEAGSENSANASSDKIVTVLSGGNGTRTIEASVNNSVTSTVGDSIVTISGKLSRGDAGVFPSIDSEASGNSSVTISGVVEGGVVSEAEAENTTYQFNQETQQTITANVYRTDGLTSLDEQTYTAAGGSASIDLTGNAKVATLGGDVAATGLTGASVTVAKGASVGDSNIVNVSASAVGSDRVNTIERNFTRDSAAGTAIASQINSHSTTSSAVIGDANVTVAGSVTGSASSDSDGGAAKTVITGQVGRNASATAMGVAYEYTDAVDFMGQVSASSSTDFLPLVPGVTKTSYSTNTTYTSGDASVVVDTDTALKNLGVAGVAGNVDAQGVTSASITIANGSKVGGSLSAVSNFSNGSNSGEWLYKTGGITTKTNEEESTTLVGGDASVAVGVKSTIGGSVSARGDKSATVTNAGDIANSVSATSLGYNFSKTRVATDVDNVALRKEITTRTYTGVGGTALVTNAAGATIGGDVTIAAGAGTVTNNGGIAGGIIVGSEVNNHSYSRTDTVTDRIDTITQAAALTSQTYTINQNNFLGGGIDIRGATVADPFGRADAPAVKTSNVSATVNLNNGSVTLGDIVAQRDENGNRLTSTTLNLNGSGFLGADKLNLKAPTAPSVLPEAVLSAEAQKLGFDANSTGPVRILGVEAVNKADAGTFVLNLAGYEAPTAPGLQANWSADVGSINVKAGEIQLTGPAYDPTDADGDFIGIKGNINVDGGSLVVGRRTLVPVNPIGNSLTTGGKETITGVKVALTGDYNQTANGTTVVGVSPSLVRQNNVSVGTVNGGTEVLGPIQAGANVPYFTTPANGSSAQSSPSRVDVTGKLTLGGKVVVDVTKDAIYSANDGYTLFTYTDAASAVSATVSQSISSPFVSFELKNDTAAKTVSIAAKRTGYASVATNPNAASAAAGLDALIPSIVQNISQDANGGAVFSSVNQMGLVQDAANIISGLDWRLTLDGAKQVFNELSSAEIYGSLAAIEQNSALTESFESAAVVGATGQSGFGIWINPVGRFARYGGTSSGASKIRDNSYGGAFGFNLGYSDEGTLGIGFAYAEHDITARGTPETAKARTYSLGLDWKHNFAGAFHAGAQFVYGFSDFDVTRKLTLLDRTTNASFKGREWNANAELGYDLMAGSSSSVMPYAKVALRHWSLGGFTEAGGAGIGVSADRDSKTVFAPEVGVRLATTMAATDTMTVRPFGKFSYTFQGDVGSTRDFTYAAGGTPFSLKGVDPKGYGSVDAGINALFNERIGVFVQGGINFGGSHNSAEARGGLNVRF